MKHQPEIEKELMEISPLVAGILRTDDLYSLPKGYFDKLADNLLSLVQASETETLPPFLGQLDKKPCFPIPGNYFESFPEKLMGLIKTDQALSASEEIGTLSPLLSRIDRRPPFSVPAGYFSGLPDKLVAGLPAEKSGAEEVEIESPLMSSLKNKNLYAVPQGYFDKLPEMILNRAKQESRQAKILILGRSRTFLKYAAAAVVAGAMLIGGSLFFYHPITPVADTANPGLTTISDQEILNYLEAQNVPLSDMNNLATVDLNENDAKDLLSDISDEELQQYLNEHISPKDLKDN